MRKACIQRVPVAPWAAYFTKDLLRRENAAKQVGQSSAEAIDRTIAPDYFPSGDHSSCGGTFFLEVNRYKLCQCRNNQNPSYQVGPARK
jgi:hypothetical protein